MYMCNVCIYMCVCKRVFNIFEVTLHCTFVAFDVTKI